MIRSVDSVDRQEAIEQARAAAQVAREAQTTAANTAPAETSNSAVAQQAQAAATEAADLSSASNQLSQQWSAVVSSDAQPKSETHESKPTEATEPTRNQAPGPANNVPSDAYEGVSATDKASLTDGTFSNAQAQYQAYMQGAVRQVQVELENGSRTEDVALEGAELAAYQANFHADNGMNLDQINRLQGVQATVAQNQAILDEVGRQQKAATTFANATYGLNERDKQLLADPKATEAQERYEAASRSFSNGLASWERMQSGLDGGGGYDATALQNFQENFMDKTVVSASGDRDDYVISNPRYRDLASFTAGYVDPATGLSGQELAHLSRAQTEQIQGDAAMKKLAAVNVGSFSRDPKAEATPASQAFTVIGKDQMDALLAQGNSSLGKGFVLEQTGQLIVPDEHETGVYFLSNPTLNQLRGRGVIDEANGGLNIDGLYLDGGNATIGTSRPSGGLFGSLLNGLSHILPGGAVGRMLADAVTDTTEFVNRPILQTAAALGDEHGLVAQAADLAAVTVDVSAHANETGNATFAELARRSADDAGALQLANTIGSAMISTGVLAGVGAALVVSSSAVLAGQAQLRGQEADANAGIWQAATAYAASALMGGTGDAQGISAAELGSGGTSTAASATVTTAGNGGLNGLIAQNFGAASPFVSGAASNLAGQFMNGQDIDLRAAALSGALGYVGANTQIGNTGINAVQVAQLGQGLASGNANQIASTLFSMGASALRPNTNPDVNRGTDQEGKNPESNAPQAPVESDGSEVPGPAPQSTPTSTPNQAPVQRTPDAMDRASAPGSTEIVRPGGTRVIISSDGAQTVIRPEGVVLETRNDSNMLTIRTATQDRAGFDQAFAAAQGSGSGVFQWNGQLYNTATGDQIADAAARIVALTPGLNASSVADVRNAVGRAISDDAMDVARTTGRPNVPGFNQATLNSGVAEVVAQTQEQNNEIRRMLANSLALMAGGTSQTASTSTSISTIEPDLGASRENTLLRAVGDGIRSVGDTVRDFQRGLERLASSLGRGTLDTVARAYDADVDRVSRGIGYVLDTPVSQMFQDLMAARDQMRDSMTGGASSLGSQMLGGLRAVGQDLVESPATVVRAAVDGTTELGSATLRVVVPVEASHQVSQALVRMATTDLSNDEAGRETRRLLGGTVEIGLAGAGVGPLAERALLSLTERNLVRAEGRAAAGAAEREGAEEVSGASRPAEPLPSTEPPAGRVSATPTEPVAAPRVEIPDPNGGPPWRQVDDVRIREVEVDGVRWQEVQSEGVVSRSRTMRDIADIERGAPALDIAQGGRVPDIGLAGVGGTTQTVRIHGAASAAERAYLESALADLPPAARQHLQDIYLTDNLGGTLDASGAIVPGSRVAGLAGEDGRIALDRALMMDRETMMAEFGDLRATAFHEIGHGAQNRIVNSANEALWGQGTFVHSRAAMNAAEDVAETFRVVMQGWSRYQSMSAAEWASEPAWEKMMEVVRAFGGRVSTRAEIEAARAVDIPF